MKRLLTAALIVSLMGLWSAPAFAQGAAVNVASFANPNLPNGNLAQGLFSNRKMSLKGRGGDSCGGENYSLC